MIYDILYDTTLAVGAVMIIMLVVDAWDMDLPGDADD